MLTKKRLIGTRLWDQSGETASCQHSHFLLVKPTKAEWFNTDTWRRNRANRRYMIKAQKCRVISSCCTVWATGMVIFFFRALWFLLSQQLCVSQRLSRPVVAMQGKSSHGSRYVQGSARLDHKGHASNLQTGKSAEMEKNIAAAVESWHKPDTLGWTTLPDT